MIRSCTPRRFLFSLASLFSLGSLLLTACARAPRLATPTPGLITVTLVADGASQALTLPAGALVRDVLAAEAITPGELDRVTPSESTPLEDGTLVRVVRVSERLEIEETILPFERQIVHNEGLAAGETRLLQPGANGAQETTFRIVFEDGVEVSRSPIKTVITAYPVPEIVMIGSQASFTAIPIAGALAYISSGNAWIMTGSSGARRPLTVSGDLDGRVFELSSDGRWLLFTTAITDTETNDINHLWAISTSQTDPQLVDLKARNVIHFADWSPTQPRTFAYSTAEPRSTAPGWQANNELIVATFNERGRIVRKTEILEPSAGGLYGWWGTAFAWSPDGTAIAYARADSLGLIILATQEETVLREFTPFQTFSDWAWVPSLAWAPGGLYLYTVHHGEPLGLENPEASQVFDVAALSTTTSRLINLVPQSGMFALPAPSPVQPSATDERPFQIAYLQALDPLQSAESRYRLWVMDRDGSNARPVFPPEGEPGLEVSGQHLAWSPESARNRASGTGSARIALIYQGNLWVVDLTTGQAQQLTGDGQASEPRWVE